MCRALEEFQRSGLNCSGGSCSLEASWLRVVVVVFVFFIREEGEEASFFPSEWKEKEKRSLFSPPCVLRSNSQELFAKVQVSVSESRPG